MLCSAPTKVEEWFSQQSGGPGFVPYDSLDSVAQEVKILGYTWLVTNHADFAHAIHKASQRVILDDLILISLT